MSLSQWFAQFAAEEKRRQARDCNAFFGEIDALTATGGGDFPDPSSLRRSDLPDLPRERW